LSNRSRQDLWRIYQRALAAVDGRHQVAEYLQTQQWETPTALIAIGKAACHMAAGAYDILGDSVKQGLLITKYGHLNRRLLQTREIQCIEASHPLPDTSSIKAGERLISFIEQLHPNYPVLILISGGASALVEVPKNGVALADLRRTNQWMLTSGLDIQSMNQIRKSLSTIKAGRLASYLEGHPVLSLVISDVPGDDIKTIGSGLLTSHQPEPVPKNLPSWLADLVSHSVPLPTADAFNNITQALITVPATARAAAGLAAKEFGYEVYEHDELIVGNAEIAGRAMARHLLKFAKAGIHIWSGETTVILPEEPGQGGRCQVLALTAACEIIGVETVHLLAASTDGNDGNQEVAGALVDGGTIERGGGLHKAKAALERANSGAFLQDSEDLIRTGPTGTNVMDIMIGLTQ